MRHANLFREAFDNGREPLPTSHARSMIRANPLTIPPSRPAMPVSRTTGASEEWIVFWEKERILGCFHRSVGTP
jgi:hypothetical protein